MPREAEAREGPQAETLEGPQQLELERATTEATASTASARAVGSLQKQTRQHAQPPPPGDTVMETADGHVKHRYNAFLTHSWAEDELGRSNHDRVARINAALKERGVCTWFDDDRMTGHVQHMMASGIDESATVVVFVTRIYMAKVNGDNDQDNCRIEFNYALRRKKVKGMVVVVMEEGMAKQADWTGVFGCNLGGQMYVAAWNDNDFEAYVEKIAKEVKRRISVPEQAGPGCDSATHGSGSPAEFIQQGKMPPQQQNHENVEDAVRLRQRFAPEPGFYEDAILKVSGAGEEVINGYYKLYCIHNGKPRYLKIDVNSLQADPKCQLWTRRNWLLAGERLSHVRMRKIARGSSVNPELSVPHDDATWRRDRRTWGPLCDRSRAQRCRLLVLPQRQDGGQRPNKRVAFLRRPGSAAANYVRC